MKSDRKGFLCVAVAYSLVNLLVLEFGWVETLSAECEECKDRCCVEYGSRVDVENGVVIDLDGTVFARKQAGYVQTPGPMSEFASTPNPEEAEIKYWTCDALSAKCGAGADDGAHEGTESEWSGSGNPSSSYGNCLYVDTTTHNYCAKSPTDLHPVDGSWY